MITVTELREERSAADWNSPPTRWKWGKKAAKLFDGGQTYGEIGKEVGLGEGDVRHSISFARLVSRSDANRLKGVAWRSVLTIVTAKTENQRRKLIDAATRMNSTELKRYAKSLERAKPVPRLRGDPFKQLTEQADTFAAACDVFAKQAGDAETTAARRKRLIKSLSAVRTAITAAVRAARQ